MKRTITILLLTAALASGVAFYAVAGQNDKQDKTKKEMKTIQITKKDFLRKVVDYESANGEWKYLGDKPAIVDFYADWCGPCRMIAPILEELAEEYDGRIYIYKVNTEQESELAGVFDIRSIPSLLFIPMEGQPQMARGAMSKEDFRELIDEVLLQNDTAGEQAE